MNWTKQLNEKELIALLPASAAKQLDSPDRAAKAIGKDLATKGLIPMQTVHAPVVKSAKAAAKKAPAKKVTVKFAAKSAPSTATPKKPAKKTPKYKGLWSGIKKEFHLFLCTDDKKYASSRKKLDKEGGKTTLAIVGTIAAAIAPYVGTFAVCIPFVTVLLLVCLDIGRNAFCGSIG